MDTVANYYGQKCGSLIVWNSGVPCLVQETVWHPLRIDVLPWKSWSCERRCEHISVAILTTRLVFWYSKGRLRTCKHHRKHFNTTPQLLPSRSRHSDFASWRSSGPVHTGSFRVVTTVHNNDTTTWLDSNCFLYLLPTTKRLQQSAMSFWRVISNQQLYFIVALPFARWQHVLDIVT